LALSSLSVFLYNTPVWFDTSYLSDYVMSSTHNGFFITLEGGEASGKSSVTHRLFETLTKEHGLDVIVVHEPGGTPYGLKARELFLTNHGSLVPEAEVGLLLTMKVQLLKTVIIPALEAGKIVLCDRYTDTLLAYQHHAKGHDRSRMQALLDAFDVDVPPDLTLFLDVPPVVAVQRLQRRRNEGGAYDDLDAAAIEFHEKIRNGFVYEMECSEWSKSQKRKVATVNADQPFDVVVDTVLNVVLDFIRTPKTTPPISPQVTKVDVLAHLQSVGRTPQQDNTNIIQEIAVLSKVLETQNASGGLTRAAIGGLYYQIDRLAKNHNVQMSLMQLAEQYASAELGSFCVYAQDVMAAKVWARGRGLNIASTGIACLDGVTRHMLFSVSNQTDLDGNLFYTNEFIHNPHRYPPPFSMLPLDPAVNL
jgi:dTMP kinase